MKCRLGVKLIHAVFSYSLVNWYIYMLGFLLHDAIFFVFQVTQATARFCKVDIIAVEDSIFEIPFRGLLRFVLLYMSAIV